jgi:hypothetical protein
LLATNLLGLKPYLVFASSFFSGAFSPPAGASPPGAGVAGAGSAGAGAGAGSAAGGGGGGGGAGSSFLPHPANARVKVKRDIPDNKPIFLPIISSPPFPSHISKMFLTKQFLLHKSELDARLFNTSNHMRATHWNNYFRRTPGGTHKLGQKTDSKRETFWPMERI